MCGGRRTAPCDVSGQPLELPVVRPEFEGTTSKFGEAPDKTVWQLTQSLTVGEGILITVYQRAR